MYHVTKGSQWDPLNCLFAREGLREGALGSYVVQWHYPLGSMLMPVLSFVKNPSAARAVPARGSKTEGEESIGQGECFRVAYSVLPGTNLGLDRDCWQALHVPSCVLCGPPFCWGGEDS